MNLSPIQPVICITRLSSLLDQLYYSRPLVSHYYVFFFIVTTVRREAKHALFFISQPPSLGAPRQEELVIWMVVHRFPTSLWDNSSCHGQRTHLQRPQPLFMNFNRISFRRIFSWQLLQIWASQLKPLFSL